MFATSILVLLKSEVLVILILDDAGPGPGPAIISIIAIVAASKAIDYYCCYSSYNSHQHGG